MNREHRTHHNWSLAYAQQLALELKRPLTVMAIIPSPYQDFNYRHTSFILEGLKDIAQELFSHNISFDISIGDPISILNHYAQHQSIGALIIDFHPLQLQKIWKQTLINTLSCPIFEVDAHNIIPCWKITNHQITTINHFRKITQPLIPVYLDTFPSLCTHPYHYRSHAPINWNTLRAICHKKQSIHPISHIQAGQYHARQEFNQFQHKIIIANQNKQSSSLKHISSELSPYLNFGHISAQQLTHHIRQSHENITMFQFFLDNLTTHRSFSDYFCEHNLAYNLPIGRRIKNNSKHMDHSDHSHINPAPKYTFNDFKNAKTHDKIWNDAHIQLINKGTLSHLSRQYWIERLLQWSGTVDIGIEHAIYFNDTYAIDGNHPNSYKSILFAASRAY